jgi:hypothetical protein
MARERSIVSINSVRGSPQHRPDGILAVAVGVDMRHAACHAAPRSRRFGNATM